MVSLRTEIEQQRDEVDFLKLGWDPKFRCFQTLAGSRSQSGGADTESMSTGSAGADRAGSAGAAGPGKGVKLKFTPNQAKTIIERFKGQCAFCGTADNVTAAHVIDNDVDSLFGMSAGYHKSLVLNGCRNGIALCSNSASSCHVLWEDSRLALVPGNVKDCSTLPWMVFVFSEQSRLFKNCTECRIAEQTFKFVQPHYTFHTRPKVIYRRALCTRLQMSMQRHLTYDVAIALAPLCRTMKLYSVESGQFGDSEDEEETFQSLSSLSSRCGPPHAQQPDDTALDLTSEGRRRWRAKPPPTGVLPVEARHAAPKRQAAGARRVWHVGEKR
eukprot:5664459-Amphidinium_carterae.1